MKRMKMIKMQKSFLFSAMFVLMLALTTILLTPTLLAEVTLKVGVLPPKGTTWANTLEALAEEVATATKGEVKFKMYFGAVSGDEPVVLRKIRMGQMSGGVFTGRTLGDISGDVRIMEVPFTFYEKRDRAWNALSKLSPIFNEGLKKNKFKNLGFLEVGQVYLISSKKASNFEELKGLKIWSWDGDLLSNTLIQSMNLVSVPLALPDVLASLSTGIIDAAYASPLAILAMQWQTKVKYLIDFPVTYSIGAFLVHDSVWNKIPKNYQDIVEEICKKHIQKANELTIKENVEALQAIKDSKITFVNFPAGDIQQGKKIREDVISKLKDKLFSAKVVELIAKEI
ncbi:MAG: TRAP transporter substrate-binding protein DctP [Oligoflexia bacterium]|nr:TRAP transporter substrate-binding protein DctP [Oligoflexia bacterium]MBF0365118.1 TRAP transporter substrate-binding protein DctP [Oligoflexia bacterium]